MQPPGVPAPDMREDEARRAGRAWKPRDPTSLRTLAHMSLSRRFASALAASRAAAASRPASTFGSCMRRQLFGACACSASGPAPQGYPGWPLDTVQSLHHCFDMKEGVLACLKLGQAGAYTKHTRRYRISAQVFN